MNAEFFHDAMNELDDDLIAETDALRRGERTVRPAARYLPRIAALAACAALVWSISGLLPFFSLKSASGGSPNGAHPESAGDVLTSDSASYGQNYGSTAATEEVTLESITLTVPMDWGYYTESGEDGSYDIVLEPALGGATMRVGYHPAFGVCGTGLREEERTFAGMAARVGYYDGSSRWSYVVFSDMPQWYVAINGGVSDEIAFQVLDTLVIGAD